MSMGVCKYILSLFTHMDSTLLCIHVGSYIHIHTQCQCLLVDS